MIVLGIDPGSTVTGYGVVTRHNGRLRLVDAGCVRTEASTPMSLRLTRIHSALTEVIARHAPDAVAIETVFAHRSSTSALKLGQARGVALLAVGQAGLVPFEYNPSTIKRAVGAHGKADKHALKRMVSMLIGEEPPGPTDVADAVAIAITHHAHARSRRSLEAAR